MRSSAIRGYRAGDGPALSDLFLKPFFGARGRNQPQVLQVGGHSAGLVLGGSWFGPWSLVLSCRCALRSHLRYRFGVAGPPAADGFAAVGSRAAGMRGRVSGRIPEHVGPGTDSRSSGAVGSGGDEGGEVLGAGGVLPESDEQLVETDNVELPGRGDFDSDRSAVRCEVDQQAAFGAFGPDAFVPVPTRQVVVGRQRAALSVGDFQIRVFHDGTTG